MLFPGLNSGQFRRDNLCQINREVPFLLNSAASPMVRSPKGRELGGCDALSFQMHAQRFEMSW